LKEGQIKEENRRGVGGEIKGGGKEAENEKEVEMNTGGVPRE